MKNLQLVFIVAFTIMLFISCSRPSTRVVGEPPAPTPVKSEVKAGWEMEWQKTLADARKEGKVVVYGPPGADIRRALTEEFQKAYPGIDVYYTGAGGAQIVPKVKAERRAGLYIPDIHIGGTTSIVSELKQYAAPIEPLLILPEVKDGKYWSAGKLDFGDAEEKYNLVFTTYGKVAMAYNSRLLDPSRAKDMSYWDLTGPEFKGKVVMNDPRAAGPGQAAALFYYLEPKLGKSFLKSLAANEVLFTRDDRLLIEWVSRGKYTVALGHSELILKDLQKSGLPDIKTQPVLKEGTFAPNGYGSLIILDNAPHPAAAKIYANWLLSKEGQTAWAISSSSPSRRIDVSTEMVDSEILLKPGISYLYTYKEEIVLKRAEVLEAIYEIFGRG